MCGIIAAFNKKGEVNDWVVDQYQEQHGRGQKGFGMVFVGEDQKYKVLRACEPTKAMLDLYMNKSNTIIMHHRLPTSTDNYLDQTHPIKVSDGSLKYDYLVVHNGVISNDDEIKKKHEELGFVYNTAYETTSGFQKFNDSESLAIEVARFIEGQTDEIGTTGSAAFIALQLDKEKDKMVKIFYGRNQGSPLNAVVKKNKVRLSSEGEGEEVEPFTLFSFKPNKFVKRKEKKMTFASYEPSITSSALSDSGYYQRPAKSMGFADYDEMWGTPNVEKTVPEDKNEETKPLSAYEKARLEAVTKAKEKIDTALEDFYEESIEGESGSFYSDAGETLKVIANELYNVEKEIESLEFLEQEAIETSLKE